MRRHLTYSSEFKLEAARLVTEQGQGVMEAARVLGVSKSALRAWIKQLNSEQRGETPKGSVLTPEQKKIRELENKIRRLEEDKLILKKASALLMSDFLHTFR